MRLAPADAFSVRNVQQSRWLHSWHVGYAGARPKNDYTRADTGRPYYVSRATAVIRCRRDVMRCISHFSQHRVPNGSPVAKMPQSLTISHVARAGGFRHIGREVIGRAARHDGFPHAAGARSTKNFRDNKKTINRSRTGAGSAAHGRMLSRPYGGHADAVSAGRVHKEISPSRAVRGLVSSGAGRTGSNVTLCCRIIIIIAVLCGVNYSEEHFGNCYFFSATTTTTTAWRRPRRRRIEWKRLKAIFIIYSCLIIQNDVYLYIYMYKCHYELKAFQCFAGFCSRLDHNEWK